MTHWLMRHGEAAPAPQDAGRPLTARGRHDVERVLAQAAAFGVQVAEVRHSGLRRARETAEAVARVLCPGTVPRLDPALAPEHRPEVAAAALEEGVMPLLLVGHLPHLARLVGLLTAGSTAVSPVRFNPATLVGLDLEGGRWRVMAVLTPELIPGSADPS